MDSLEKMRKSIDDIDNAIIALLAERFKITNKVGLYKAQQNLPVKDIDREAAQYKRIAELAKQHELDSTFATTYLTTVITQVVKNHESIAANFMQRNNDAL